MEIIETIINGLSLGGTYAMIALGYTMVYGIAKMLNFAHGDVIMVGGYTLFVTLSAMGNPILGLLLAVVVCVVLGITIEKVAYRPLRGASPLAVLITAIGVSYLLQSVAQIIFTSAPRMVHVWGQEGLGYITLGELKIQTHIIVTLVCSIIIMVVLSLFVKYTRIGRAMIAVSEDKGAAQLMGINVNMIITITFAIGSALAAFAGFFMLMKSPSLTNTLGAMPGIKAFTAAVIGGIGSIPGAMLGGLFIGMIETVATIVPGMAPYTVAIEFLVLIIVLLVRPTGILGKKRREKV